MARWLLELRYLLEFLAIWPCVQLIRRVSESRAWAVARGLSRVAYRLMSSDRKWALRNLQLVFGDHLTPSRRTELAMQAFENLFTTGVEMLRWTPEWMKDRVISEGAEQARRVVRAAQLQGIGSIVISPHLGNFELIAAATYNEGWRGLAIYRPQNNWRVERLIQGVRQEYLREMIPRGTLTLLTLMHTIREGLGVGLMIDINWLSGPVFVDFLGFQAASPPGVAALALATRCPVILIVAIRERDGRHRHIVHPPFELIDTGNRRRDIAANTQQYMKAIEPYVLAYPEQYNWLHPRWRFRPSGSFWKLNMPYEEMAAERTAPALALPARH